MKKNVIKTAFAAVCVIAAGLGGLKAYNYSNQSQAELLLAANVDAFSQETEGEGTGIQYRWEHEQCWNEDHTALIQQWKGWSEPYPGAAHSSSHFHECSTCDGKN